MQNVHQQFPVFMCQRPGDLWSNLTRRSLLICVRNITPDTAFLIFFIACLFYPLTAYPANASRYDVYRDYVYSNNIRTVQMHPRGQEQSYPVIEFGTNDELMFSFDDLDGNVKNFQYRIIHCNADWTESGLFTADYLEGFDENRLDNYRFSFNTAVTYTHYSLALPNFDVNFKLPGNYIIKVYEDYDETNIVITRRFMISESRVNIRGRVHRPQMPMYYRTGQQVTFSILHPDLQVRDPHSEIYVTVMQNGRTDNSIKGLAPVYIRDREIVYEDEEKLVFPAGNEFRSFDIRSLRYQTEYIRSIEYANGINHVELQPSESRQYSGYFSHFDINGGFLIRNEEGRNPSYDADYVMVYFTLPWDAPVDNGNVFVLGALWDWNFYDLNKMEYNFERKAYELDILVKQGYYNYQFVILQEKASEANATFFEGNFFETENDYFIMVYHRPPGSRFDRLVGTQLINSRK